MGLVKVKQVNQVYNSRYKMALAYYLVFFGIRGNRINYKFIEMIAAIATYGQPYSPPSLALIMKELGLSNKKSVYNIVNIMKKKDLLHKVNGKIKLIDPLIENFKDPSDMIFNIKMNYVKDEA